MPDVEEILKIASNWGIGVVILGFVGWCVRSIILWAGRQFDKYIPPAIEAHISMMSTLTDTQRQLAVTHTQLSESQKQISENTSKLTDSVLAQQKEMGHCRTTTSALLGLCDVFEDAVAGHANEPQIKQGLTGVKTVLINGK